MMKDFIIWLLASKPAKASGQLSERDIQLFRDAIKHIATALKAGDRSLIESAMQCLQMIERKLP